MDYMGLSPALKGALAGLVSYLVTFGALAYTALLRAHLDEVGGGLAPKAPRGAAAGFLVRKDRRFYWSMSAGPQGD